MYTAEAVSFSVIKKIIFWATWFVSVALSLPGVMTGYLSTSYHYWIMGKDPSVTLGRGVQLIFFLNVGLWCVLPATLCLVFVWRSQRVPSWSKVVASLAVMSAWAGELMFLVWHDTI
jgi:hypothetical protein